MQTVSELGDKATILKGQVGEVYGRAVIVSEYVREDLNETGVFDNTTVDKTVLFLVRKDGFTVGQRGSLLVEMDKVKKQQTTDLIASSRKDFKARYDLTTNNVVVMGYNLTA